MGQSIFVRQKTIHCGKEYREVDIIPYTAEQKRKDKAGRKRAKKEKISAPKQISLNENNSRRYLTQLANANFTEDDIHMFLSYDDDTLPKTIEEAERNCTNYLRRVKEERRRLGLPPLKYIRVASYLNGDDGSKARLHHHIIMNAGLDRTVVEKIWGLGIARSNRLQLRKEGTLARLCKYLAKQGSKKKKWSSSRNLIRPYATNNDSIWSNRTVDKLAKNPPPREYWEKRFPGWTLTDNTYGMTPVYNEVTATWSVYLKLRRIM